MKMKEAYNMVGVSYLIVPLDGFSEEYIKFMRDWGLAPLTEDERGETYE